MKISLLTIWHEKNYGAEMQAYATVKILQQLGHDVKMIDFRLSDSRPKTLKLWVIKCISSFSRESYKFNQFWKSHIPTTQRYSSIKKLKENPPQADMYLVGSDQVWNPGITKIAAPIYFLDFGDKSILRMSYASSFGVSEFDSNPQLLGLIEDNLKKFKAISCRESTGVEFLENRFNLKATNVLDPTLLFDGYPELIGNHEQKQTLVYYPLSPFLELEEFCKENAKKLGLEYLNTNNKKFLIRNIVWNRQGIEEWIRNIAEASLVVTPSFHGLAFSLIYRRQFIIIANGTKVSTRITSILAKLGLSDRYFTNVEDAKASNIWESIIDYSIIDKKLSEMRKNSITYLHDSL